MKGGLNTTILVVLTLKNYFLFAILVPQTIFLPHNL